MAVPKKKHSKQRSRTRRTAWIKRTQLKLINNVRLVTCGSCNTRITERTICPSCGKYKGKQLLDISKNKKQVTVVNAD